MKMDEKQTRAELFWVSWPDSGVFKVGVSNVERIVLVADGYGPSCMYDRIHIISKGSRHQVFIAHNCEGFEYLQDQSDEQ